MTGETPLSEEDRAVLRRSLDGTRRPDLRFGGCLVAFAGMLVLTLTPAVGGWVALPDSVTFVALGLAVLLLLGGAAVGLLSQGPGTMAGKGEDPREVLQAWANGTATREAALAAAGRLLRDAPGHVPDERELPAPAVHLLEAVRSELYGPPPA